MINRKGSFILALILAVVSTQAVAGDWVTIFMDDDKEMETCVLKQVGWIGMDSPIILEGRTDWRGNGCNLIVAVEKTEEIFEFCSVGVVSADSDRVCGVHKTRSGYEFKSTNQDGYGRCFYNCIAK